MKALKFSEFYEGHFTDDGYELYLLRDSDENALYIGISRDSIWHRWFGGGTSHMDVDVTGKVYGKSNIGEIIERRFPSSWNWTIELWMKEDCLKVCATEFLGKDSDKVGIDALEPYMIVKFEPLYNVAHSSGHHEDPLTTKRLDQIYKHLFE